MRAPADANLDELKKKARRRLVGAVVLALAAAVFVPMLLESDERPLGDDVSVRIPAVDPGKFVNRLNSPSAAAKSAAADSAVKGDSAARTAPPKAGDAPPPSTDATGDAAHSPGSPAVSLDTPTARTLADAGAGAQPATGAAASDMSAPPAASPAAQGAKAAPAAVAVSASDKAAAAKSAVTPSMAHAAATKPSPPATGGKASRGAFDVQLAAFADDKGANALANRLKRAGHAAFTEPVTTSHGKLWRVRVGPFATHDDAIAARDKLKREGQNGIVAAHTS